MAADDIVEHLGWRALALRTWPGIDPLVWTSHEALPLDYEVRRMGHQRGSCAMS